LTRPESGCLAGHAGLRPRPWPCGCVTDEGQPRARCVPPARTRYANGSMNTTTMTDTANDAWKQSHRRPRRPVLPGPADHRTPAGPSTGQPVPPRRRTRGPAIYARRGQQRPAEKLSPDRRHCARSHPAPLVTRCSSSRLHGCALRDSLRAAGTGGGRPGRQARAAPVARPCPRHSGRLPGMPSGG
jgi:hypothetical protein